MGRPERRQDRRSAAGLVFPAPASHSRAAGGGALSSRGLHWEELEEDIALAGLLAGEGDLTQGEKTFAA